MPFRFYTNTFSCSSCCVTWLWSSLSSLIRISFLWDVVVQDWRVLSLRCWSISWDDWIYLLFLNSFLSLELRGLVKCTQTYPADKIRMSSEYCWQESKVGKQFTWIVISKGRTNWESNRTREELDLFVWRTKFKDNDVKGRLIVCSVAVISGLSHYHFRGNFVPTSQQFQENIHVVLLSWHKEHWEQKEWLWQIVS